MENINRFYGSLPNLYITSYLTLIMASIFWELKLNLERLQIYSLEETL